MDFGTIKVNIYIYINSKNLIIINIILVNNFIKM